MLFLPHCGIPTKFSRPRPLFCRLRGNHFLCMKDKGTHSPFRLRLIRAEATEGIHPHDLYATLADSTAIINPTDFPMKNILFAILTFLLTAIAVQAQGVIHQSGYVRTVGRPNLKSGKRLPGVLLRISGQHNLVKSGKNGTFTLTFSGMKEGRDAFRFSSIRLAGYDLQEKEVIGRPYAISSTIPIEVVLVPQALKEELQTRIRQQIEASYSKKLRSIQSQQKLSGELYQKRLAQLEAEYEKRDLLVDNMVERYASIDYAHMRPFEQSLCTFIERGELEKADSLLATTNVNQLQTDYTRLTARGKALREALASNTQAEVSVYQQLVTILEGKADIFKLKFENDSAAFYLEKVALLDTTNIEKATNAAIFFREVMVDHDKALAYNMMALRQAIRQKGEKCADAGICYENMAIIHTEQEQYREAFNCYGKALSIQLFIYGDKSEKISNLYNNMGTAYYHLCRYQEALNVFQRALDILQPIHQEQANSDVAWTFYNLSLVHTALSLYSQAKEYAEKALHIWLSLTPKSEKWLTSVYTLLGNILYDMEQYAQALEYQQKAFGLAKRIYGPLHPKTGDCHNLLGKILLSLNKYEEAWDSFEKALLCYRSNYGEKHSSIADIYLNEATILTMRGKAAEALPLQEKALHIYEDIQGYEGENRAICYQQLAMSYMTLQQYDQCMEMFDKALRAFIATFGKNHEQVANTKLLMASVWLQQNQPDKALALFEECRNLLLTIHGERSSSVANCYMNIGAVHLKLMHFRQALDYFKKSRDIYEKLEGNHTETIQTLQTAIYKVEQLINQTKE